MHKLVNTVMLKSAEQKIHISKDLFVVSRRHAGEVNVCTSILFEPLPQRDNFHSTLGVRGLDFVFGALLKEPRTLFITLVRAASPWAIHVQKGQLGGLECALSARSFDRQAV